MELLFFYIQDKKSVPPSGINFGGEFIFQYSIDNQELLIKENPLYIPHFFNDKINSGSTQGNITNISAIVGQNGAGKTSLLNSIIETLARGSLGIKHSVIVAIKSLKNVTVYFSKGLLAEQIKYEFETSIIYEQIGSKSTGPYPISTPDNKFQLLETVEYPKLKVFNDIDFIFFSNIYDHSTETHLDGLKNISTNYLSGLPHRYKEIEPETARIATAQANDKDEFRYEEIRRQIDFINNFHYQSLIPFTLPDTLIISLRHDFEVKYTRTSDSQIKYHASQQLYYDLSMLFSKDLKNEKDKVKVIKYNFIGASFFNFLHEATTTYSQYINVVEFNRNLKNDSTFPEAIKYLLINTSLDGAFYPTNIDTPKKSLQESLFTQKSSKLLMYIKMIEDLEIKEENIAGDDNRSIALYIRKEDASFFEFYKKYRDSYIDEPYLNFTWRNLSSGEKALFSIYARFYSLIDDNLLRKEALLKRNIIILLDEPDAFLHPAWQKQLVDTLLDFLKVIYASDEKDRQRNIQLCFTTNNPLSITDLPHNNVILLQKDENDELLVTDFSDNKRTFAANIFDLYTDSFFLSDGFTGGFAVKKINAIFEDLNSPDALSDDRKENIKKIIQLIGEPLIKNKLVEMYHSKEVLSNDYDSRIKRLEHQIFKNDRDKKK